MSLKIRKEAPVFKIVRKRTFTDDNRGGNVNTLKPIQAKVRYIPKHSESVINSIQGFRLGLKGAKRDSKKKQELIKMKALIKKRKRLQKKKVLAINRQLKFCKNNSLLISDDEKATKNRKVV